jgi:two-component system cell cycle sensor histidine kinase/response regulator CckA
MRGQFAQKVAIDPENWRASLFALILKVSLLLGFLVYLPSLYAVLMSRLYGIAIIDTLVLLAIAGLLVFDRFSYRRRAAIFCCICYILGAGLLVSVGSISQVYLFGFSVVTTLLLGLRAGFASAILSSLTMLAVGVTGIMVPEMLPSWNYSLPAWIVVTLNFALVDILITLAIGVVLKAVNNALKQEIAARQSLDRERKLLRTLIDTLPDVVFTKDTDGRFVNSNPATLALVGFQSEEELAGKTVFDLFPHEIAELYHADDLEVIAGKTIIDREEPSIDPKGNTLWYLTIKVPLHDQTGQTIGLIGISRNITGRKKLEAQLRQSQKMDAVGQLAGGVAHDFNNLLTIISGYSELLLTQPEASGAIRESARAISDAGERATALTRQLLAFSRRTILEPKVLNVNAVIAEMSKMLRRLIGEDIVFATVLEPELSWIRVDPGQLDQVVMNLAVNARDAMPTGGRLTIETANILLSDNYATTHLDCSAGHHVMLAITDTGRGMVSEVLAHIFEPFYTTKGVGRGTGLGLAMVFGIVQQSGGGIHVYSELGRGTTFKIYFPVAEAPLPKQSDTDAEFGLEGTETILLVEDEDEVRRLALLSLEKHGYHVLTAADGNDALRVVESYNSPIDLLLTDVVMPNLSGPELAEALQARHPQLMVLFMSGYTDDAVVRHGLLHAEVAFIQKPYTPQGLAEKIRQVLDGRHLP